MLSTPPLKRAAVLLAAAALAIASIVVVGVFRGPQ